jgi:hypothetical protein
MNFRRQHAVPKSMSRRIGMHAWVWGSALVVAAVIVAACSSGSSYSAKPAATTTTAPAADVRVTAASFKNLHLLTHVDNNYIDSLSGHLDEALAVARAGKGEFPVGTVMQLVPQEAMVKRRAGFSPATNDWEFFSLDVSAKGTKILSRGGAKVLNRFGDSCAGCHSAAAPQFDFMCGKNHGCAPLPVGDAAFAFLVRTDPRPK